eukprot:s542_g8.t1
MTCYKVDKLKNPEDVDIFKAKLRFRRAMARGEPGPEQDLEAALEDLRDAAHRMPRDKQIRTCLENCKDLLREARGKARGKGTAPEGDQSENPAESAEKEEELSPALETVAACVGKCLGKLKRCWRWCHRSSGSAPSGQIDAKKHQ